MAAPAAAHTKPTMLQTTTLGLIWSVLLETAAADPKIRAAATSNGDPDCIEAVNQTM